MPEFAPICIYLVIIPVVSLNPLDVPFPFASNSLTYLEKLSAYEYGSDPFGDARSFFDIRFYLVSILFIGSDPFGDARSFFDIRFYLVSILFIIPNPKVIFFFPGGGVGLPLNKIDPFGSRYIMAFYWISSLMEKGCFGPGVTTSDSAKIGVGEGQKSRTRCLR
ncbi:putative NADH:ubiquinone reductase (H(+)-translocating) [Helianthus annuus]|uniref:NADH-ubiquinone oxidoreductase chain 3 n=1 Tax=Helianthus annuus TaxID=4232 RepID=A0A251T253_HELAN|nr:putative NADH:ubiquinone reductase (H(+)-translocating) [Helianthus annuus]KAJ0505330.1 putative NADH:ubiquinone reductase (H(+)-translocating) [Helianthus annuus]KAJ0678322.1 putative NADH:ubiquinone reductase (H(+)-translocating) [Helianthus annuus]KAJ0866564.1 putative NADH:ubiquinone reductase (H(+)-translocating) [Helianthus annuus]